MISTKLSEEEYARITNICKQHGFTTSKFIKQAIKKWIESEYIKNEKLSLSTLEISDELIHVNDVDKLIKTNLNEEPYFKHFRKRIDGRI